MTPQFLLLQIELNHDALASVELTKCSSVSKDHLGFEISLSNWSEHLNKRKSSVVNFDAAGPI